MTILNTQDKIQLVLKVLNGMKACLDINDTYVKIGDDNFNLHRGFGICWHVLAYTPSTDLSGIGIDFLEPTFLAMGLHAVLPVEMQLESTSVAANELYHDTRYDRYNPSTEVGQTRIKLVNDLIKYFNNVLTTESEAV